MHSCMITHIYQEVYPIYFIVSVECVRGITHLHLHCPFALVLPFSTCIIHSHLHYPFALALPICICINHLHSHYPFALALPFCTCIIHLHLRYPFVLALPICTCIIHCTCITQLHLHYPFTLALSICTCICITHYPSIVGINNACKFNINCKALRCVILSMVLSSNNEWLQHRL